MRDLLGNIKSINQNCKNISILFSGGRDSLVMLDLFVKYAVRSFSDVIFMYFCKGLEFEERILRYYEKRFLVKIIRIAHPDVQFMKRSRTKQKRISISDLEKYIRQEFKSDYIAYGFRKDESLQRRGQLAHLDGGVDYKYKKVFPVAEWSAKHMNGWIRKEKLLLPPEYKYGFRDINSFKGESIEYIYNNYPEDYQRIIKSYPDMQGELMRYRIQNDFSG